MLLAISPRETTSLIWGCAQETGCAPPWFRAAAGAASTAKTAVVARMRLIRLFGSSGRTSAFRNREERLKRHGLSRRDKADAPTKPARPPGRRRKRTPLGSG